MQQRFRRLALFVGATALAAGGLFVIACGTDNGTTPTPGFPETGTTKETGTGSETGTPPDGGSQDAAAEADCTKNPILRDFTNGYRCAFIDAGGRDSGTNCTNSETCCETNDKVGANFQPSYCATGTPKNGDTTCKTAAPSFNSSFDAGNAWECADKNACPAGDICCMVVDPGQLAAGKSLGIGNTLASDKNHPPACGVKRAFNEGGSRCRTGATCPTGEIKLCSLSDQNCVAPTTCTPFVDFQQTHRGTCL